MTMSDSDFVLNRVFNVAGKHGYAIGKSIVDWLNERLAAADPMPVFRDLCQKIHDACDKAGIPSHHPKMASAALPKPMLPQERLAYLSERLVPELRRMVEEMQIKERKRMEVYGPELEADRKELEKLRAMQDGSDCTCPDQRGKVFCCPTCNGGHFGSENAKTSDIRVCHDEFNVGCRWKGPDSECYVKPSVAVSRLRENVRDIDDLAAQMLEDDDKVAKREKKRSDRRQRTLQAIVKIVLPQGKETLVQAVERVKAENRSIPDLDDASIRKVFVKFLEMLRREQISKALNKLA